MNFFDLSLGFGVCFERTRFHDFLGGMGPRLAFLLTYLVMF